MTEKCICIHGHFYQPPRENPWLEEIEVQDSAHPYHDWNERISAECYARNANARILDDQGWIVRIINNYARMSFNFGPTLMSWLERHQPAVYEAIIEADHLSRKRFSGHGSALAQAYNHMILPLAGPEDRYTQILWGVRDFTHRFGRKPEGMWLPETAVNKEALQSMAEMGIRFTVLSPHQAERIRPPDSERWDDVSDGCIDPHRPYLQRLGNGHAMAVFFYDGGIAHEVAFDGLLNNGDHFADRLMDGFNNGDAEDQLVHIATDGETFGHHHHRGDMALAYALDRIESDPHVRLSNYAEYLSLHQPAWEVQIKENTSWSCPHGVERWKSDCGCNSGGHPGWHQAWREPLRNALDWLRDTIKNEVAEDENHLFTDISLARNDYIRVIIDRSPETIDAFLEQHLRSAGDQSDRIRALKIMEMLRQAMLMYTSCGWFFDELSGIETVQVIQYAGRAVQIADALYGRNIETPFMEMLARAESNLPQHKNGRHIYEKWVRPARVDLKKVGAHYAISAFFEDYPETVSIFCYTVKSLDNRTAEAGKAKTAVGRATVTSRITGETDDFDYAVLHLGDHNITCGIGRLEKNAYSDLSNKCLSLFNKADFPAIFQLLGDYFNESQYPLTSLFRDEQRKVLEIILASTRTDIFGIYRRLYDDHVALMRFIAESSSRIPKSLYVAGEIVINNELNEALSRPAIDTDTVHHLVEEARYAGIELDTDTLEYALRRNLEKQALALEKQPERLERLSVLAVGIDLVRDMPFGVNAQKIQNVIYHLKRNTYPDMRPAAKNGDPEAKQWVSLLEQVMAQLKIRREG